MAGRQKRRGGERREVAKSPSVKIRSRCLLRAEYAPSCVLKWLLFGVFLKRESKIKCHGQDLKGYAVSKLLYSETDCQKSRHWRDTGSNTFTRLTVFRGTLRSLSGTRIRKLNHLGSSRRKNCRTMTNLSSRLLQQHDMSQGYCQSCDPANQSEAGVVGLEESYSQSKCGIK